MVVIPDSMSMERQRLARAYGAEVVLTPAAEDVDGAVKKARQLVQETPGGWMPNQFANPHNPQPNGCRQNGANYFPRHRGKVLEHGCVPVISFTGQGEFTGGKECSIIVMGYLTNTTTIVNTKWSGVRSQVSE